MLRITKTLLIDTACCLGFKLLLAWDFYLHMIKQVIVNTYFNRLSLLTAL